MKALACTVTMPRGSDLAEVRQRLNGLGRVTLHSPVRASRQWLDTFDWRLHRSGQRLERWGAATDMRLRLSRIDDPCRAIELPSAESPAFASDFPSAVLRRRVGKVISVRRLLPQCEMQAALQWLEVHDDRDKLVVRIEVWRPPRRGDLFVRVTPFRGYEAVAKRATKRLLGCVGASAKAADPLSVMALRLPIAPGKYPRWVTPHSARPGADARTDVAVRQQLAHFADIMALNIDGMRRGLDSEFLHQFRVGLTRSRALLRNATAVFPAGRIRAHAEFLKQLAGETGSARDAQVHALVFPDYVGSLPADERAGLQPLLALVHSEQQRTQHALAAMLASSRFRRRWQSWVRFVHAESPASTRQVLGAQTIGAVAPQLLAKRARRVERKGRQLNATSPAEAYHELRKDCKKLKYLIDSLDVYVCESMPQRTVKRLKAVQNLLGEHQDLDVHQAALAGLQRRLQQQDLMPAEAQQAVGALQEMLCRRAERVRSRFPEIFSAFCTLRVARAMRKLLR